MWPGIAIGVVIALVVAGGAFGVVKLRDRDATGPSSTPSASGSGDAGASNTPTAAMPSTDASLARFYDQKLTWKSCGSDECASMSVPLDYADPTGKTIELKMVKVAATGKRVGSLVVNPGGPGGSAIQYAQSSSSWPSAISQHFDLIGVDPRGVGESTPLECLDTAGTDQVVASDPDPDTDAERATLDDLIKGFGDGCLAKSGDLAKHMSTVEVAKDMDVLRQLLGESKLDYFGASYGTFIGATYAGLFPTHVGRMVLDGAIDPALSNSELNLGQAHGFETALRAYVADCVSRGSCVLGDSVDAGTQKIRQFIDQLDAQPLPTNSSRKLTAGLGVLGIWLPLYVKSYWPILTQALTQAMDQGNGSTLLALADQYTSRGSSGYTDNSLNALYAVNCLDHDDSIPVDQVPSHYAEFEKASPTFGRIFAYSLSTCSTWPVQDKRTSHAISAKGAPPIVVVGTTRDPATPYAWAKGLARELDSGVFVSRNGDGHTGFNQGNSCVDSAVEDYLVEGKVPKNDLRC
ncbi:alpha/beta hydrolase [Nocardioides mangrovicus]|uniref:Alpha/beta hydrolase n=1 Tax=Nocardioides mangrovicus TaxID=2478913 RepID=A0A3L8P0H4_9ACTN|nr:alpha/beta hydrolase [Nocardioides mangrovicus]